MSNTRRELARYGLIIVLGLIVDLAAARAAVGLGASLELASITGVLCGAAFNYALLEVWAFAGPKQQSALRRPLLYLFSLGVTVATRLGVIWMLSQMLPTSTRPLIILGMAAVASFAVNFLLSKNLVFRRSQPKGGSDV